ncbi:COG4960 Flp pilus assembly protein [Vibrio sp. B1FLJ16]|uniref:A24 family peptidase n=1 Tax=Vibrio sp. B1FLJ16 TaxID=2751178 RepID=UPI001AF773DA|nr:prepilin peptidase [Vibrio sp. B1FLJ16]CAD7810250.1 COG4960 Flp pilus assembly protein [Vibrio sp. B1FLJ16]CAE6911804.1 COG4960 Flp pilus assembly protein [Vibrio sp. B1FLJ16]
MSFVIWFLLTAIGVSDAQRHRIPNQLIVFLFVAVSVDILLQTEMQWWFQLKGFLITFAVCLGLYVCKVMAGGDVKLLAVIGLWLGTEAMLEVTPYIVLAGGVMSLFYLALHTASSYETIAEQLKAYAIQKLTPGWRAKQPLVIPFAPAIVVGLAYYFYIQ